MIFELFQAKVSCEVYVNTSNQTIVRQDCYPEVRKVHFSYVAEQDFDLNRNFAVQQNSILSAVDNAVLDYNVGRMSGCIPRSVTC